MEAITSTLMLFLSLFPLNIPTKESAPPAIEQSKRPQPKTSYSCQSSYSTSSHQVFVNGKVVESEAKNSQPAKKCDNSMVMHSYEMFDD